MSKPSRDKLMADSQAALKEAIKVFALGSAATTQALQHAHDELNRTGDALANEPGISIHLKQLKDYKVALKIRLETRAREAERNQAAS